VLRRAAALIGSALRRADHLCRWGGEEFVVLLPDTDAAGAVIALDKALARLRSEVFVTASGQVLSVTFSAGVAQVGAGGLAESLEEADRHLYVAKHAGRARVIARAAAACEMIQDSDGRIGAEQR
jgi:two-component system cell cycle response regulator